MFVTLTPYLQATVEDRKATFDSLDDARLHLNALTNAVHRTRGELEDIMASRMRAEGTETGDEDLDHCLQQVALRTMKLEPLPELQLQIRGAERRVAAWSEAFARLPEPSDHSEIASHEMLQVQFMVVRCRLLPTIKCTSPILTCF